MLCAALLSLLTMPVESEAFHDDLSLKDVNPDFLDEVEYLAHRGIIQGYSNGQFGALSPITRVQAVTMIMRDRRDLFVNPSDPGFTDVTSKTANYRTVADAVELGIIQGKVAVNGSKYFDAHATLTRTQMALILTRAYAIPLDRRAVGFKDVPESFNSKKQIDALTLATGFFVPYDGMFRPNQKVTREEFSALLARLLERTLNPMGLQFIPDDEYELVRPPIKWYTEQELMVQQNEMIELVNKKRTEAGLLELQVDEQMMNLTHIKARGVAKYPNSEHSFQLVEDFYEAEYGVMPEGSFTEVTGGLKDAQSTLNHALGDPIHKSVLLSKAPEKIGVGLAQDLDGSFQWVLFFWDYK